MIKTLFIKNFILIDELEINFKDGLNIITGETGSGKSILMDAVDLAFGARASKDQIKTGTNKAVIEITVEPGQNFPCKILAENEIEVEEGVLVISREISTTSNKHRINGTIVSQGFIQNLRKYLLDIHSQHETYSYIQPKTHIYLLDNFGTDEYKNKLKEYRDIYNDLKVIRNKFENLMALKQENIQKQDFLSFQIEEITNAGIDDVDEYENLINERSVLVNAEELKEITYSGYATLYNEDRSIIDMLNNIENRLIKASEFDEKLAQTAEVISSSTINLKEVAGELRDYSEGLETDPQALSNIEERINLLDKLRKKYGPELPDVIENLNIFQKELDEISYSDEKTEELSKKLNELEKLALEKAGIISDQRVNLAEKLSNLIQNELVKLEMPKVQFKVNVESNLDLTANGKNNVEFLIAPNTGESLKPLAKIASGGEISRVMLAIKCILAQNDLVNTVIFDEIDTGVSGKTSQAVGEALARLAKSHQILCITHQPIIAAMADEHIFVEKLQSAESTRVEIKTLDKDERINAVAKLASGDFADSDSINFAKKLLSQADSFKNQVSKEFFSLR